MGRGYLNTDNAGQGGRGPKIPRVCRTSFVNGPLIEFISDEVIKICFYNSGIF